MRRWITALLAVLLLTGLLPQLAFAADPVTSPVSVVTSEDTPIIVSLVAVDADPGDIPDVFEVVDAPSRGSVGAITLIGCTGVAPTTCTAEATYTPGPDLFGSDTFGYTASSGDQGTSEATRVSVTVTPVNDPPVAHDDSVSIVAATATVIDVLGGNGGSADSAGPGESSVHLRVVDIPVPPSKGTATISLYGASILYTPWCETGSDTFTYSVSDGEYTDTATVAVTINRPGEAGLTVSPRTAAQLTFVTNSTMNATVPMRLSWCGVTSARTAARSYRVQGSTNSGASFPTTLFSATTSTRSTRHLSVNQDYQWRVRTTDTAGEVGPYRRTPTSIVRRYQDTSSRITYSGTWRTASSSNASGGSRRYTSVAGASATITVTNVRAFAIVGPKSSARGSFRVYVDGELVKTVSETSTVTTYRPILYWRGTTAGVVPTWCDDCLPIIVKHVIRIEAVGNGRLDLDAILTLAAS